MIVFPGGVDIHTHVAGAALNFARAMTPENQRARRAVPAHARAAGRHRRADAHHVCHRLPLRRHGLHDGQRGGRARPVGQAHARRAARHADRRQGLLPADGQQRDRARPAGGRRGRAGEGRRRLADLGGQGVRRQGGQSRRRHRLEVGQGRQEHVRAGRRLQQGDAGSDHRRAWPGSSTSSACRTRCTCTATTWARRATSPPRSKR